MHRKVTGPVQRKIGSWSQGRTKADGIRPQPQPWLPNWPSAGVSERIRCWLEDGHQGALAHESSARWPFYGPYTLTASLGGGGGEISWRCVEVGELGGHLGEMSTGQLRRGMRASGSRWVIVLSRINSRWYGDQRRPSLRQSSEGIQGAERIMTHSRVRQWRWWVDKMWWQTCEEKCGVRGHISSAAVTRVSGCCAVIREAKRRTKALAFGLHSEVVEKPLPMQSGDLTSHLPLTSNPAPVTPSTPDLNSHISTIGLTEAVWGPGAVPRAWQRCFQTSG